MGNWIRNILIFLSALLLIWVLWNIRIIVVYFFVAAVLSLIGRPLMQALKRINLFKRPIPDWLASLLVVFVFVAAVGGFVSLIIPIILQEVQIISNLDISQLMLTFEQPISRFEQAMEKLNIPDINRKELEQYLHSYLNLTDLSKVFGDILDVFTATIAALFSIFFITFFLLKDGKILNNIIETATPDNYVDKIKRIFQETFDLLSKYFTGVLIQISIVGLIVFVGLSIVGIENALLIGFLAGLFNLIPYVGPILGGLTGLVLGLSTNMVPGMEGLLMPLSLKIIAVFGVAQLSDNILLQPLIFSKSVKAHPLEIFIVILIGGTLAGIPGMMLAVPVYSFLRIIGKEFFQGLKVVRGLTKDL